MNKIKIGYYCADVNPQKTKSIGIYKITKEILNILLKKQNLDITLILSRESEYFFKEFNCKKKICIGGTSRILNKLFLYPAFANKIAKKEKLDFLFFPKGHIPFFKKKKIRYISIINDLIPFYYLKKGKLSMVVGSFLIWWSAKFSDDIITISEYSKSEIRKITTKPITVVPLGCKRVNPKLPSIKDPFVFVIGNKNPHKNLEKSIKLIEEYNLSRCTKLKTIHSLGELTEEELAGYYKMAKFSIFLSDIEGFGLPLIESYGYGTPVVFNNKTSLAEIGMGLPGACNIENEESVFKAIDRVLKLNRRQISRIQTSLLKKYSWERFEEEINKSLKI